jgi:hypothetical protein
MSSASRKTERRKHVIRNLNILAKRQNTIFTVNYCSLNLLDNLGKPITRPAAIAAKSLASGHTTSFSIHHEAELAGISPSEIKNRYGELEEKMLARYFEFLNKNTTAIWMHWDTRSKEYGFSEIHEHFRALNSKSWASMDENKQHDLKRIIGTIYGLSHSERPQLHQIIEQNRIDASDFLDGRRELDAFMRNEFDKLLQSTLCKVEAIAILFERLIDGTLKTNASWQRRHGIRPSGLVELAAKHWIYALVALCAATFFLLSPLLQPSPRPLNSPAMPQKL